MIFDLSKVIDPEQPHYCHAKGCRTEVPPKLLMCARHWRMVPRSLQQAVWRTYRPGQEVDKRITDRYVEAATAAINHVAELEGVAL